MKQIDFQVMPPLSDDEYQRLKADINENGQLIPIEVDEFGNILDGYNRMKICRELGIKPETVVRAGLSDVEKDEMAYTLNLSRRHLSHDQKIEIGKQMAERHPEWTVIKIARMIGVDRVELSGQLDGKIRLTKTEGADGRSRPASETQAERQRETIRNEIIEHPEKSDREIAREVGTSHVTVGTQRKKMVTVYNPSNRDREALKDPDIVRRMAETDSNVASAIREKRRDSLIEHLESVETQEAKAVQGVYDVIVIDPPWPMQRIELDARPHAIAMDYPTMSLDEIKALEIPAADDCHVFMWTTQKFLRPSFDVFDAWGVKHCWTFVWVKDNGYKPMNLPKSSVEFVLYGHIGNPKFIDETNFWSHITAPITGHSEKPDAFYDMVRRVTAGRRLDMFNRRKIDGFDVWGKEANE